MLCATLCFYHANAPQKRSLTKSRDIAFTDLLYRPALVSGSWPGLDQKFHNEIYHHNLQWISVNFAHTLREVSCSLPSKAVNYYLDCELGLFLLHRETVNSLPTKLASDMTDEI